MFGVYLKSLNGDIKLDNTDCGTNKLNIACRPNIIIISVGQTKLNELELNNDHDKWCANIIVNIKLELFYLIFRMVGIKQIQIKLF